MRYVVARVHINKSATPVVLLPSSQQYNVAISGNCV